MNPLKEVEVYIEEKMEDMGLISPRDKALLSAHLFIVAATSPKNYQQCVDRYLERMPAGTAFTHDLQMLHESISEWIAPKERMPRTIARKNTKRIILSTIISDKYNGRYSYFVDLMIEQGMDYPSQEDVKEFAEQWIYDRIDDAIERGESGKSLKM